MFKRSSEIKKAKSGQATVEFALVLIVLLAVLYGLIEISRLLLVYAEIQNAAREGSQYASLHPGVDKGCIKTNAIVPKLNLVDTSDTSIRISLIKQTQTSGSESITAFNPITVTVEYTWTSFVNIMPDMASLTLKPLGPLHLEASSTDLIERPDASGTCPDAPGP